MYVGSGVDQEGNFGVYLWKDSMLEILKVCVKDIFYSHAKVVDFGRLYLFEYYVD